MTISLTSILCGVFGFLLGSAGVAQGTRKRNPLLFLLGLCFFLAGAVSCFLTLVDRAVEEVKEEEEAEEAEQVAEETETAAPAEESAPVKQPAPEESAPSPEDAE